MKSEVLIDASPLVALGVWASAQAPAGRGALHPNEVPAEPGDSAMNADRRATRRQQ